MLLRLACSYINRQYDNQNRPITIKKANIESVQDDVDIELAYYFKHVVSEIQQFYPDEESCRWIELMKCMRAAGVGIEALIEYVALFQRGDETIDARKALLIEQRNQLIARMEDMQASLERLNDKIDRYGQGLMVKERQLRRPKEESGEDKKPV